MPGALMDEVQSPTGGVQTGPAGSMPTPSVPPVGRRLGRGLENPLLPLPAVLAVAVGFFAPLAVLIVYSFWPTVNGGVSAVLYCFIWLYFSAAGAGPLSLDARRRS